MVIGNTENWLEDVNWGEVAYSGLIGLLIASPGAISTGVSESRSGYQSIGNSIISQGNGEIIVNAALLLPSDSKAYRLANASKINNSRLGKIYVALSDYIEERISSLATLAVENRLREVGFAEAEKYAPVIANMAVKKDVDKEAQSYVLNDKKALMVYSELVTGMANNDSSKGRKEKAETSVNDYSWVNELQSNTDSLNTAQAIILVMQKTKANSESVNILLSLLNNNSSQQGNLSLQSNVSGDIINQGGEINERVFDKRGLVEAGGNQRNGENSRQGSFGKIQEDDTRGTQGTTSQVRRTTVKYNNSQVSYIEAQVDNSEGGKAYSAFVNSGINAVYCDGAIHRIVNGNIISRTESFTAPDGTVYVSNKATLPAKEIYDHERVHVADFMDNPIYADYEETALQLADFASDTYTERAKQINDEQFDNKYDIGDISTAPIFMREILAYINQYVMTDPEYAEQLFGGMFTDWNAVVEAVHKFNKDMGADFSEAASFMPENSAEENSEYDDETDFLLSEPDISEEKVDWVQSYADGIVGHDRKTEGQRMLIKAAQRLGWKIGFSNVYKKDGNGKIIRDENGRPQRAEARVNKTKKEIVFDYQCPKPIKVLIKHELTHFLENDTAGFFHFVNDVMKSNTFKNWIRLTPYKTVEEYQKAIIKKYKGASGFENTIDSKNSANFEIVANFVAERLFKNEQKMLNRLVEELTPTQRTKLGELIHKFFVKLKYAFEGMKQEKEIRQLEKKWIETYKKAEAVWQEKQQQSEYLDKNNTEDVKYKLVNNQFPPYNESQSDANEWSARWALSDEVETGDQKLVPYHNRWYLIEKFDDVEFGYRIMERVTKKDYEYYKGVIGDVRNWEESSIMQASDAVDSGFRESNGYSGSDGAFDNISNEHPREDKKVFGLGTRESSGDRVGSGDVGISRTSPQRDSAQSADTENTIKKEADLSESAFSTPENSNEEYSISLLDKETEDTVDQYTEEQYNNFGWVRYNGVLSNTAFSLLSQKIAEIKTGGNFHRSRYGDYIIPVGEESGIYNILVYTDGDITNPHIRKVIEIDAINDIILQSIKDDIYYAEREKQYDAYWYVEQIYGDENISLYTRQDSATFRQYAREQEGRISREGNTVNKRRNEGGGTSEGFEDTVKYSISLLDKETEDIVSQTKKKKSVDTTSAWFDLYDSGEITREELIANITQAKKKTKENPKTIADSNEDDANTTPPLKRREGESRGDKKSKFYSSIQKSDIFDEEFKAEAKEDSFIEKYRSVTNKET